MCDGTPCPCNLLTKYEGGRLPNHRAPRKSNGAKTAGVVCLTLMALAVTYGTCFMIYYW